MQNNHPLPFGELHTISFSLSWLQLGLIAILLLGGIIWIYENFKKIEKEETENRSGDDLTFPHWQKSFLLQNEKYETDENEIEMQAYAIIHSFLKETYNQPLGPLPLMCELLGPTQETIAHFLALSHERKYFPIVQKTRAELKEWLEQFRNLFIPYLIQIGWNPSSHSLFPKSK